MWVRAGCALAMTAVPPRSWGPCCFQKPGCGLVMPVAIAGLAPGAGGAPGGAPFPPARHAAWDSWLLETTKGTNGDGSPPQRQARAGRLGLPDGGSGSACSGRLRVREPGPEREPKVPGHGDTDSGVDVGDGHGVNWQLRLDLMKSKLPRSRVQEDSFLACC